MFEIELPVQIGQGKKLTAKIWGDNIVYMGSERTKVKFKERFALDLY